MATKRLSVLGICLLIISIFQHKVSNGQCTTSLNRYIQKHSKTYQVVLLANTDYDLIAKDDIVTIVRKIPLIHIDVTKMSSQESLTSVKTQLTDTLRKTSMLLIVSSFHNGTSFSKISSSLKYVTELSPAKVRPKVILISATNQKSSFQEFLHKMWLNRFLDFTILEIRSTNTKPHFPNFESFKVFVHYYNPFRNSYFRKRCSSTTIWFPNKLLNLHGYKIKGGLIFKPPLSLPKYDKSGQLQSYIGADLDMFKTLSEAMNFSTYIESNVNSTYGTYSGNKATGMLKLLITNKINILVTSATNLRPRSEGGLYEFSTSIDVDTIVALLPITHRNVEEQYINLKNLFFKLLSFVGFVIVMWAMIGSIKNEEHSWKPEYIAAIILGVSIPRQPIPTCHRIIFLYFIVIGFHCSITFLGGLTASKVKNCNEVQIKTFRDLAHSNLVPFITRNHDKYLNDDSNDLQLLKKKIIPSDQVETKCVSMLVKHRNVSCLIYNSYAKFLVEMFRDKSGQPITKILKQTFFNVRRVMVLERNSPYKKRLDQLLTIFVESGLRKKWENNLSIDFFMLNLFGVNDYNERVILPISDLGFVSNLGKILIVVALSGCFLSLLVFGGELLLYRYCKSDVV